MIFVVIMAMLLAHKEVLSNLCQVYPSEYAYNFGSVQSVESASANCRRYPAGLKYGIFTDQFVHCNGTQLKLTDSNLGTEQYISSDYYEWSALERNQQLLFIFQKRVNLTTITLHFYSDSDRGLPRLRLFVVSDDFDVWDPPSAAYRYVEVAAVSPGGEPAGHRNVSIEFNFNTKKVLLFKFGSAHAFAVNEVEFSICHNIDNVTTTAINNIMSTITTTSVNGEFEQVVKSETPYTPGNIPSIWKKIITTVAITTGQTKLTCENYQGGTTASLSIAITLAILFIVSLTINMIVLAVWLYKKRNTRNKNAQVSEFEVEGNPCYEATHMKKTDDAEAQCHVYEMV